MRLNIFQDVNNKLHAVTHVPKVLYSAQDALIYKNLITTECQYEIPEQCKSMGDALESALDHFDISNITVIARDPKKRFWDGIVVNVWDHLNIDSPNISEYDYGALCCMFAEAVVRGGDVEKTQKDHYEPWIDEKLIEVIMSRPQDISFKFIDVTSDTLDFSTYFKSTFDISHIPIVNESTPQRKKLRNWLENTGWMNDFETWLDRYLEVEYRSFNIFSRHYQWTKKILR